MEITMFREAFQEWLTWINHKPNQTSNLILLTQTFALSSNQYRVAYSVQLGYTLEDLKSNLGRSKTTISSLKHPDHLQCPPSLQLNENHSFFSGSKVAKADSLTTHICLEPSLQISGAMPPLNLCDSMTHLGQLYFTFTSYLCTYISQVVTSFLVL